MSHHAWHYEIAPATIAPLCEKPIIGTHCGEGIETREQAIADIARAHGVSKDRVRVRRAGEDVQAS